MMHKKWIAALAIVPFLQLACTTDRIAGNGSQIGNPMVVGVLYQSDGMTPASDASVFLRKKNTLADVAGAFAKKSADTVMTDINGQFAIDSIDTGIYIVEGTDGGNNFALIDPVFVKYFDSTLVLPPDILKPAGAIKGVIRLSEGGDQRKAFVLAFGLDRFAAAETDGAFKFGKLAEGNYHLRILSLLDDYGVLDSMNIPVTSGDTTDIGVIELPFTGIPTLKNVTISYDTLRQWVTLRWSRLDTTRVKSFNMYRRIIDPTIAVFTHLNSFPIIDTVYIDSFCEQNKTYEYRVAAVDSNETEGVKSAPVQVRIALYDITPDNFVLAYDTLKQAISLYWSNPDPSLVESFNVYRRNVNRNEAFWTPFNNSPIVDTVFIDSTFNIYPNSNSAFDDSITMKEPTYEYCVGALIKGIREGVRSAGKPIQISAKYITPTNVTFSYDTLKQEVRLCWSRPDTTLVKSFNVFRRNIETNEEFWSQINQTPVRDTLYLDSTGGQNQTYEYRISSFVKNSRAEVKSSGVTVHIAACFIVVDSMLADNGSQAGELINPNDIAVSTNGDLYLVDQGNSRIQVFDSTMHYKRQFGSSVLQYPLKMSVDDQGNVFVVNYSTGIDHYSIFVFDSLGTPLDTIPDSMAISDLDVRDGLLYVLTTDRFISVYSYDGIKKRSWRLSSYDGCKWMIAGNSNTIFVSTGSESPDLNKVIAFDSLGRKRSSLVFPDYPFGLAFDEIKQLLYVVCYNGMHGSIMHIIDTNSTEKARYKIQSDDQNISIGLEKNGVVLLVLKSKGEILKLKPLFQ